MRHTSAMKCTCTSCDARGFVDTKTTGRADPTNTGDLRRRYTRQINEMWRRFGMILRQGVVDQNMLGLGGVSAASIALTITASAAKAPISETRSRAFQAWLDQMLIASVVDPAAGLMRTGVIVTYARGVARAKKLSKTDVEPINAVGTIGALAHLALVEMQGISEAVSQQIVRAASLASINSNMRPIAVLRSMLDVIRKVGVSRSTAMVDMMLVKTHGTATLDQFEAAQIKTVGLITELKNVSSARRVGDGTIGTEPAVVDAKGTGGPGSRSHKTEGGPSARTVRRIRAAERAVEALGNVSVQTAGDDLVCPICEDIEANSPYSIDEARSLIPAHPYCRCAFIPEDEEAVSDKLVVDYNEFHDPDNGQFTSGPGAGGDHVFVVSEHHPSDNQVKVLGIHASKGAAVAHAAAGRLARVDEDHPSWGHDIEVHQAQVHGSPGTDMHVIGHALHSLENGGGHFRFNVFANKEHAQAFRKNLIKSMHQEHGWPLDWEHIPQHVETVEIKKWNREHPHDQIDPNHFSIGPHTPFGKYYEAKYLEGKKVPFPGHSAANANYKTEGVHVQLKHHKVGVHHDNQLFDYNENHDPDNGQFSSGGAGGGSNKSGALANAFHSFASSDKVKNVISKVAMDKHMVKKGLSFGLQSLLSHATGLDASTWKLNEDVVEHTVHHFADIASISKLQAKAYLQKAVGQLIKLRQKKTHDAAIADRDDVLSFLLALQKALKKVPTDESKQNV